MRPRLLLAALVLLLLAAGLWLARRQGGPGAEFASPGSVALAGEQPVVAAAPGLAAPVVDERERRASSAAEIPRPAAPGAAPAAAKAGHARLTGRVVDESGAPIAEVRIIQRTASPWGSWPVDAESGWPVEIGDSHATRTGPDGRFELAELPAGELRLGARKSAYAPLDRFGLALAKDAHLDLGDLTLEAGSAIAGSVVDARGSPVAGARVLRVPQNGDTSFGWGRPIAVPVATTDAEGRFRADEMPVGPWLLIAATETHPDGVARGATTSAGAAPGAVVIRLADGASIQGRVLDVPEALAGKLFVQAWPQDDEEKPATEDAEPVESSAAHEAWREMREVAVAADGTFTLLGLYDATNYALIGGARAGEGPWIDNETEGVAARAPKSGVELRWRSASTLAFRVIDAASGAPVTEFSASLAIPWPAPLVDERGKVQRTHADGRARFFKLRPEDPKQPAVLRVQAPGYRELVREGIALIPGEELDLGTLSMEAAPVVVVRVVDAATTAAISGADVELARPWREGDDESQPVALGEGEDPQYVSPAVRRARTDENGVARLSSFEGEACTLRVVHTGHAPWQSEPFAAPRGEKIERDVALSPGGAVAVKLVDVDGQPVPGGKVVRAPAQSSGETAHPTSMQQGEAQLVCDEAGRALFEHLAAGLHRFRGQAPGGGEGMFAVQGMFFLGNIEGETQPEQWVEVLVSEGGRAEATVVMPATCTISGRVREQGVPLSGATLTLSRRQEGENQGAWFGWGPNVKTDGYGRYSFENQREGNYVLGVSHPTRSSTTNFDVKLDRRKIDFDVDLPVSLVEGRVTAPDGRPIAGAEVTVEAPGQDSGQGQIQLSFAIAGGHTRMTGGQEDPPRTTTDADGRYSLRGVASDCDLTVRAAAKGFQPGAVEGIRVAPNSVRRGVDLTLARAGSLRIEVERAAPSGNSYLTVLAARENAGEGESPRNEWLGDQDRLLLEGLPPGKWTVTLTLNTENESGESSSSELGSQTVEIEAGKLAIAHFRVP